MMKAATLPGQTRHRRSSNIGYYAGERPATLTGPAGDENSRSRVTPSTIEWLGVLPVRGRIFERRPKPHDRPSVVLVSYALWDTLGLSRYI